MRHERATHQRHVRRNRTRAIQNIIDMQSDEIKQLEAALKEERNRVGTGDLRIAELQAENARLLDLIEPWVSVETMPEEEGTWQVWNTEGYQDAWFQDGRFEYVGSGFPIDPPPTHYRRIKGPSPTLIKEDRNNG